MEQSDADGDKRHKAIWRNNAKICASFTEKEKTVWLKQNTDKWIHKQWNSVRIPLKILHLDWIHLANDSKEEKWFTKNFLMHRVIEGFS